MNNRETACAYMLHNINSVGNRTLTRLLDEFKTAENIYDAPEKDLTPYMTKKQLGKMLSLRDTWDLEREMDSLLFKGISFHSITSPEYPSRLKHIPDAPFGIYCIGKLPDEERPSVSIIGARTSSEYGKYAARQFGEGLAELGVQIISGMARGIDGVSQLAAINVGGDSYGVLGSGVDVCYPPENRNLYELLKQNGGVISEYNPGTEPKPQFFPPRNRIISGLSDIVLVIEARQKSGTLITVDMALEQGREVFALPGRICDRLSEGCNGLIRQGAGIATCPEDIVEFLRRNDFNLGNCKPDEDGKMTKLLLNDVQKAIYEKLDLYPKSINKIHDEVTENGVIAEASAVMNALVELSLMGLAGQNGGAFYAKQ